MVKLSELRLCVSACGERVYIGKIADDNMRFTGERKDMTSDFIKAIIDKFGNSKAVIGTEGETQFEIVVKEISESEEVDTLVDLSTDEINRIMYWMETHRDDWNDTDLNLVEMLAGEHQDRVLTDEEKKKIDDAVSKED